MNEDQLNLFDPETLSRVRMDDIIGDVQMWYTDHHIFSHLDQDKLTDMMNIIAHNVVVTIKVLNNYKLIEMVRL